MSRWKAGKQQLHAKHVDSYEGLKVGDLFLVNLADYLPGDQLFINKVLEVAETEVNIHWMEVICGRNSICINKNNGI